MNYWKLIHHGLGKTIKDDGKRIEHLIDKQLMQTFFAEKKFILDTTFDNFFCGFWAEYLFGKVCSLEKYQDARVLDKSVVLDDGSELPAGSMVCLNLKQAGVYHSAGARRCVGQAYTYFFREHFFNCIAPTDFKVKKVSEPLERQASNENIPNSPERYQVTWRLKREEAMRHMPHHHYKGNKFFDVLSLHQNANLNALMVKQLTLKINRYIEKNNLDWQDVVMAAPEVRGLPIATQVAGSLQLPLYTIRKKGGYKMVEDALSFASFKKGYGDSDTVELPIEKIKALAGKKVIFLDDGIASGGSAKACIKLLEKQVEGKESAKVALVLALLQHDYVKSPEKFSEHRLVKTLFDCRAEMPNQELKDEVQALNLP